MFRGVAQSGSAPGLGPGGRRFESSLPDHVFNDLQTSHINYLLFVSRRLIQIHLMGFEVL